MKRILVISWYFPPVNSSEGLVTFKLLKNSKYKYDVFTQKNSKDWAYNNEEYELVSENVKTYFSDCDSIKEWVEEGIKFFDKNKDKYDIIMTRSMAPESHEIGQAIKEKYPEIKWIASFGDPIAKNPYLEINKEVSPYQVKGMGMLELGIKRIFSPKRILMNIIWNYRNNNYINKCTRIKIDEKLQDQVLNNADKIIFNSEYQKDYMMNGYKEEIKKKSLILPHTFDEDFYNYNLKDNNDKLTISYIGHCDDTRTPNTFFDALKRLKENNIDLYNKLHIDFYGDLADKDKVKIIDNDLVDIVKVNKNVTYFESLEIMCKSDYLLLIDANLSTILDKNIFFAAKLADYLGSRKPIFGITMYDGPSADILRETNNIISSFSVEEIYINLRMILENKIEFKKYNIEKYNAKNVSKIFDEEVLKLTTKE